MNLLTPFYGNNVCKICKHYVLDIPTSKIPAHIKKNGIANSKVCGEYWFQFAFSHDFFLLNFSGSESKF